MKRGADRAIAHVRARAELAREQAAARIAERLASARDASSVAGLVSRTLGAARVTLNFHPDRLLANGSTVAEGLLRDGAYASQFVTGISNGSRTAFAGGERDDWEMKLFGTAYHDPPARADERPKYGALDVLHHPSGGSPRFGSCFFVLREPVKERCTFTWGDSHVGPEHVGTADAFESVLCALLESPLAAERALDDYIEAQVHGPIALATDVAALVVDPSFEGTPTGAVLKGLCERHAIEHASHGGFILTIAEVPSDFRGPRMPALAERIAARWARAPGVLDAVALGCAAADLHHAPASWEDWGARDETLQHIKQLWHVLVRFGRAAR